MRIGRGVGLMALLVVAAVALVDAGSVGAQGPVDYDTQTMTGLSKFGYLEQLDAMRWHWGECYEGDDCVVSEYEVEVVEKDSQGRDVQVTYTVETVMNREACRRVPERDGVHGLSGRLRGV